LDGIADYSDIFAAVKAKKLLKSMTKSKRANRRGGSKPISSTPIKQYVFYFILKIPIDSVKNLWTNSDDV
jgi:hypothetical protein